MLNNSTSAVTATLTTASQAPVKPAVSAYVSSGVVPPTAQNGTNVENSSINTSGDVPFAQLPYFVRSLLFAEKLRYGYTQNKVSGTPITIKYAFASPDEVGITDYISQRIRIGQKGNQNFDLNHIQHWSEENKAQVTKALTEIANKTQITFALQDGLVSNNEGINFFIFPFHTTDPKQKFFGYAYEGGDVHLNSLLFQQTENGDPLSIEPKNQGFSTVLHEVMHSLGLKHPFDEAEDLHHGHEHGHDHEDEEDITAVLNNVEDGTLLTLMSYKTDINDHSDSLRMFDLATLHYRYGVNPQANAGDTVYTFKDFNPESEDGDIYIWDGAGKDTFNAENAHKGVYINLTPGSWSYIERKTDTLVANARETFTESDYFNDRNFPLASGYLKEVFDKLHPTYSFNQGQAFIGYGTVIENAVGSRHHDTLIGNDTNNLLEGGGGRDRLEGGKGNDVLNGGEGADLMIGGEGDDVYFVDNAEDYIVDSAGGSDTVYSTISLKSGYSGIEVYRLLGQEDLDIHAALVSTLFEREYTKYGLHNQYSGSIDTKKDPSIEPIKLYGNSGNNNLIGNNGDNIIDGGEGEDTMAGYEGNDTYYVDNVNDKVQESWGGGTDTVISSVSYRLGEYIERVILTGDQAIDVSGAFRTSTRGGYNEINRFEDNITINIMGNEANNTFRIEAILDEGYTTNNGLQSGILMAEIIGGGGQDFYDLTLSNIASDFEGGTYFSLPDFTEDKDHLRVTLSGTSLDAKNLKFIEDGKLLIYAVDDGSSIFAIARFNNAIENQESILQNISIL